MKRPYKVEYHALRNNGLNLNYAEVTITDKSFCEKTILVLDKAGYTCNPLYTSIIENGEEKNSYYLGHNQRDHIYCIEGTNIVIPYRAEMHIPVNNRTDSTRIRKILGELYE